MVAITLFRLINLTLLLFLTLLWQSLFSLFKCLCCAAAHGVLNYSRIIVCIAQRGVCIKKSIEFWKIWIWSSQISHFLKNHSTWLMEDLAIWLDAVLVIALPLICAFKRGIHPFPLKFILGMIFHIKAYLQKCLEM